jgi:uncharacterized protein YndB with AHSA1/START domain
MRNSEVAREPEVVREAVLQAPADEVWEALTDPAQLAAWFGGDLRIDPRPGGRTSYRGDDGEVRIGAVREAEPGRRLSFDWWAPHEGQAGASRVEFDLEEVDGGTHLTVIESRPTVVESQVGRLQARMQQRVFA